MAERHQVCRVDELTEGRGREFVIAGRVVALFLCDGRISATDGICPHAGGPLAQGVVQKQVVTCPWHGWQFNVATGEHRLNPRITLPKFPVTVEDGVVWIEIP